MEIVIINSLWRKVKLEKLLSLCVNFIALLELLDYMTIHSGLSATVHGTKT